MIGGTSLRSRREERSSEGEVQDDSWADKHLVQGRVPDLGRSVDQRRGVAKGRVS